MTTSHHAEHIGSLLRAGLMEALGGLVPAERAMPWYRNGKLPPAETPSPGPGLVHELSPGSNANVEGGR